MTALKSTQALAAEQLPLLHEVGAELVRVGTELQSPSAQALTEQLLTNYPEWDSLEQAKRDIEGAITDGQQMQHMTQPVTDIIGAIIAAAIRSLLKDAASAQ